MHVARLMTPKRLLGKILFVNDSKMFNSSDVFCSHCSAVSVKVEAKAIKILCCVLSVFIVAAVHWGSILN